MSPQKTESAEFHLVSKKIMYRVSLKIGSITVGKTSYLTLNLDSRKEVVAVTSRFLMNHLLFTILVQNDLLKMTIFEEIFLKFKI